jgi:CBS domain-containing protein
MKVENLMTKQAKSCSSSDTLQRAAQLMWDADCGCLPVCEANGVERLVGVITDRDICMSALFRGMPLHELPVSGAMSKQVVVCKVGDGVAGVEKAMCDARIRRLPVIDEQGALVGIIGLADIAREAARERGSVKADVTESEVGDTLAAICGLSKQRIAA